jgi:hypothetical protein
MAFLLGRDAVPKGFAAGAIVLFVLAVKELDACATIDLRPQGCAEQVAAISCCAKVCIMLASFNKIAANGKEYKFEYTARLLAMCADIGEIGHFIPFIVSLISQTRSI